MCVMEYSKTRLNYNAIIEWQEFSAPFICTKKRAMQADERNLHHIKNSLESYYPSVGH